MNNNISFDISAHKSISNENNWESISVTLNFELENNRVVVVFQDEQIAQIDLTHINDFVEQGMEQAWEQIQGAVDNGALDALFMAIPAGDPVFGCLLKAGISTTIGHTISCWNTTNGLGSLSGRIRKTIRCLGFNLLNILNSATRRALECMMRLGFG